MTNPFELIERRLSAIEDVLQDLRRNPAPATAPGNALPFLSAAEVKQMTGWPNGTFYAKVAQMPEGVVIRGRSKRLVFDRARLIEWLKTPVVPGQPVSNS